MKMSLDFIRDIPVDVPADASQMQDILDIEGAFTHTALKSLFWAAILLAVIAGMVALYKAYKRFRKNRGAKIITPIGRFQSDLEKLQKQKLVEKGEIRKFYFFLSEILRRLIQDYSDYPALDKTQDEIENEYLTRDSIPIDHRESLRDFLRRAEQIKFGGAEGITDQAHADMRMVSKLGLDLTAAGGQR